MNSIDLYQFLQITPEAPAFIMGIKNNLNFFLKQKNLQMYQYLYQRPLLSNSPVICWTVATGLPIMLR
jgi:hypothetical protein